MPADLPAVTADQPHRTLTLDDLRTLVTAAEAAGVPGTAIVRGRSIPFRGIL